ncbi:MAG: aminotransferase class V-fold PLP-dependent enzyme [Candidatus Dormiibacterota bacterium]
MTTVAALDVTAVRQAYPILQELAYFNTGTYGLMAQPALARYLDSVARFEQRGMAGSRELRADIERARERLAGRIGASADEVALTGNATDGIAFVAAGLRFDPGDEVIISDQEHPAMRVPFGYAAAERGLVVRRFQVSEEPEETLASIRSLLTPRTRLLATSHVTSPFGIRLPVQEICALAHEHGALALVDGAQSFAVLPIDVAGIGCDFFSGNGHKWLGGPKGTGFLYARHDLMTQLRPAYVGDGSLTGQVEQSAELRPDGHRFEFGTRGFATPAGLNFAFDWMDELGWESVSARIEHLSGLLKAMLRDTPGVQLMTPVAWDRSSGLVSIRVADGDEAALQADLEAHRLFPRPSGPKGSGRIRVSLALFNDEDEVERLAARIRVFARQGS